MASEALKIAVQSDFMDSWYSWVVFAAAFLNYGLINTVLTSFGVFFKAILDEFQEEKQVVAWAGALRFASQPLTGVISDLMYRKLGPQNSVILGAVVASGGNLGNYFAQNMYSLIVSHTFTGIGLGMTTNSIFAVQQHYFSKYLQLTLRLTGVCGPLSLLIMPIFLTKTLSAYGLRGSTLIISSFITLLFICGSIMMPRKPIHFCNKTESPKSNEDCLEKVSGYFRFFKHLRMWLYCFAIAGSYGAGSIFYTYILYFASAKTQRSLDEIAPLFSVMGAFDIVSRLSCAMIAHFEVVNGKVVYTLGMLVTGTAGIFMATLCNTRVEFFVTAAFVAIGVGAIQSSFVPVAGTLFGPKNMSAVLGLSMIFGGVFMLLAPPMAGLVPGNIQTGYAILIAAGFNFFGCAASGALAIKHHFQTKMKSGITENDIQPMSSGMF